MLLTASLFAFDSGKSPWKATLWSAAIPGAGQFYNGSYIKAGVFFASEATFVGMAIYHNDQAQMYAGEARNTLPPQQDYYLGLAQQYHDKRQSDYWWIGTTTFLSVVDAFVDASLYNFAVKKKEIHLKYDDRKISLEYKF
jgi:TM2 domain-containing membrane protein YozV